MFPDLFLDDLGKRAAELLPESVEISFLAARILRELSERGKLCSGQAPDMSRTLFGAGPLVKRELLAALRACSV